jgi:crotonobetaine/carnitine-CoA ligase
MNTRSSVEELRYAGKSSQAIAAITQPALMTALTGAMPDLEWVAVTPTDAGDEPDSGDGAGSDESFERLLSDGASGVAAEVHPLEPVHIQYTSGTTSRPKGVVWTHANVLWGAQVNAQHEGLTSDDTHLVHLPLFHTNALSYCILAALWAGARVVLQPRFSASRFWEVSTRNLCTWASQSTFTRKALAEYERPREHRYRLWGSGVCSPPEDAFFGVKTIGWWGMTETISHPIIGDISGPNRPMSMGRAAPEYSVAVVRDDGTPTEAGEVGALLVRGIPGLSLFMEYLDDQAATKAALDEDGWLTTGDRVRVSDDGFITFVDRAKDMLKVGGENVASSEIEAVLLKVSGIREAAVVGKNHPLLGEVPVAFVVAEERPSLMAEIESTCQAWLADFKIPHDVRIVEALPRVTLDKVAKAELRRTLMAEEPGQQ